MNQGSTYEPKTFELSEQDVAALASEWLTDRGFSSWGQGFSLVKPEDRSEAAEWFARQLMSFGEFLAEQGL